MPYDLAALDRIEQRFVRRGASLFVETYDADTMAVLDLFEFTNCPTAIPSEVKDVANQRIVNLITGDASGARNRVTSAGIPDPRQAAGLQATLIEPGSTDKFVPTANPQRVVAVATNATNTSANLSVYAGYKQSTANVQGATDPVLMRFADIRGQTNPFQVTSGANATGLFVEVL